jgi:mannosyl-oligosaccharide alpha-1,2-mannosidase
MFLSNEEVRWSNVLRFLGASFLVCFIRYMQTSTGLAPESISFEPSRMVDPFGSKGTNKGFHPEGEPIAQGEILTLQGEHELLGSLFQIDQSKYVLRPETLESLFVSYRLTGDESFRDKAWRIFENLQRNCRTPTAFSGIKDVDIGHLIRKKKKIVEGEDESEPQGPYHSPQRMQESRAIYSQPSNWRDSQESFFFAETLKYLYLIFSPRDVLPLDRYVFNTEAHPLGVLVEHE